MDSMTLREQLKDKKRIVVKVGSSSLTHPETGHVDLIKLEKLVRELTDLHNRQNHRHERTTHKACYQAGMCIHWTGAVDDDLSETFHGI